MRFGQVLLLGAIFSLPAAASNLVSNGSFDLNCRGWTFADAYGANCYPGDSGFFAVLNNSVSHVPQMSQSIEGLQIGAQYQLTWTMRSAFNCCGDAVKPGAGAAIDGKLWEYPIEDHKSWKPYEATFTYGGGSNVLTFSAQRNGTDTDAAFDNIVLTLVGSPVPEPSSWVMAGASLLAFGGLRRRAGD